MSTLRAILFESPVGLGVVCFVLFAAVLLARTRLEGRNRAIALPGVLLLTVILFVMQWVVVTERERILAALDRFVSGITLEDRSIWSDAIADGYRSGGMDRGEVVDAIDGSLQRIDIYDTRLRRREVTITGDRAEMILGAIATVAPAGQPGGIHTARWRIGWVRDAGQWKIDSIAPIRIDTMPFDALADVIRVIP